MSVELQKAVDSYENYIQQHGVDEAVVNAMVEASKVAILTEKDTEYGLKVSARAKELLNQFVIQRTGGNIWALERYAQDNQTEYELLNKYYEVLKCESRYRFESFMLFM